MISRFGFVFFLIGATSACSVTATRPVQEMAYTVAALRAAKEVQADTLAPEPYSQARDWFFKARREYKLKNFEEAKEYSLKARQLAEEAELRALLGGGQRTSLAPEVPQDLPPEGKDAGFEQNPKPIPFEEYTQPPAEPAPAATPKTP